MTKGKILLRNGCVLTLEPKIGNYPKGDVLIEDGRISEIGETIKVRDAEQIDATDTIVMPGFVDAHRHAWHSLFRNTGRTPEERPWPDPELLESDDVYAATLAGLLGALEAGITTVVDWADVSLNRDRRDAALQAHTDSGLRTLLVQPMGRDPGPFKELVSSTRPGPTTTIAAGSVEPDQSNLDEVARDLLAARDLGLRIHAPAGTGAAGAGALAELAGRGLLARDVTLIHCSRSTDTDLDALAARGASVVLTPAAEMAGGLGSPPMQSFINRGIRPGLGTNSEAIAPGDLFAQMRAAISVQHATYFDLKLAGKAGLPRLLTTRDVIRYATIDGARAVGHGGATGSLEPGKAADLVVLRADRPNIVPINDPIGAVVWGMDTSNLDWVFVAGRVLMRGGVLEVDAERARQLATAAQARLAFPAGELTGSRAQARHP
jgi:cytosine/adenosine deaminase-related metal-dependent hydrolase